MIDTILQALFFLLKVLAAYLVYQKFIKMCYLRWLYGRRGVTFMTTIPRPVIGDIGEFVKRTLARPDRTHFAGILREAFPEKVPPCLGMFWTHGLVLIISDPDYVQDLFTTYNEVFQKHEFTRNMFSDMTWRCLLWASSYDPTYKPRRKLISHAFVASKLRAMSDIMFEVINKRLLEWPNRYPSG